MDADLLRAVLTVALLAPLLVFWLWMFRDMLNNHRLPQQSRLYWFVLLLFGNVFGAAFYYTAEYRRRG